MKEDLGVFGRLRLSWAKTFFKFDRLALTTPSHNIMMYMFPHLFSFGLVLISYHRSSLRYDAIRLAKAGDSDMVGVLLCITM